MGQRHRYHRRGRNDFFDIARGAYLVLEDKPHRFSPRKDRREYSKVASYIALDNNDDGRTVVIRNARTMSQISKINKLKNVAGFIQLDFFKANKYIDKAGEFLDSLYDNRDDAPKYQMSPDGGAQIVLPPNKELKVSSRQLWTHLSEPDSLDLQLQFMLKSFEKVVTLFEPKEYDRIGWRNHFIHEIEIDALAFASPDKWYGGKFVQQSFEKEISDFNVRITISRVVNTLSNKEAILFDIDVYKLLKGVRDHIEVTKKLKQSLHVFDSPEILEIINRVIV